MLVLIFVQIVQTNNNEYSGKKNFLMHTNKILALPSKQKILIKKILVDKIYKLIIKEFKLNVDCDIKIGRNHNLFQV
jgi:hypothetical protein